MSRDSDSHDMGEAADQTPAQNLRIPDHALAALEYQARRHYRRWRLERAEQIARRVVRFDLGRAEAWFLLGDVEMRRMNWQRAYQHFQQAVDCRRSEAMAWCRGGEALMHLREFERAEQWLRAAVSLDTASVSPAGCRAQQLLERYAAKFNRDQPADVVDQSEAPTQQLRMAPASSRRPEIRSIRDRLQE
ncbi:MAG: hypothetical protein ACOC9J_05430 [Persicimonas sp.]